MTPDNGGSIAVMDRLYLDQRQERPRPGIEPRSRLTMAGSPSTPPMIVHD